MKKWLIAVLLFVLSVIYLAKDVILMKVMEAGLERRMNADAMANLQDGLHIILCGAGGPLPAPKASGPCVLVIAGQRLFVVDAGTDGVRNIARMGFATGAIEAVLLTHFHSDHIDGLGELATLRWVGAAHSRPLPVYGPDGVEQVVSGFNQAYALDHQYRYQHHGDSVAPLSGAGMRALSFTVPELSELASLFDESELQIDALQVGHAPVHPAVGYRFRYKDRTALISGDTIKMDNIIHFSQGVDLLVHEALAPNLVKLMHKVAKKNGNTIMSKITHDILDYHASPVEAAETARDAGVGHLLYYHIVPPLVVPGQQSLYLNGAEDIFPHYTVGQDGTLISLPTETDEIHVNHLSL